MGDRYLISGVQLGMLCSYINLKKHKEAKKVLDDIMIQYVFTNKTGDVDICKDVLKLQKLLSKFMN